eukprot:2364890-Amphidinium_carterae.1
MASKCANEQHKCHKRKHTDRFRGVDCLLTKLFQSIPLGASVPALEKLKCNVYFCFVTEQAFTTLCSSLCSQHATKACRPKLLPREQT